MTDAQQAALTQLLIDQQNPASPRYHQWLTPEAVRRPVRPQRRRPGQGLLRGSPRRALPSPAPRAPPTTSPSAAPPLRSSRPSDSIHSVMVDGESHISNLSDPVLPAGIASSRHLRRGPQRLQAPGPRPPRPFRLPSGRYHRLHPDFTSSSPRQPLHRPRRLLHHLQRGSSVAPLAGSPINGKGITIVIVGQTDIQHIRRHRLPHCLWPEPTATLPWPPARPSPQPQIAARVSHCPSLLQISWARILEPPPATFQRPCSTSNGLAQLLRPPTSCTSIQPMSSKASLILRLASNSTSRRLSPSAMAYVNCSPPRPPYLR